MNSSAPPVLGSWKATLPVMGLALLLAFVFTYQFFPGFMSFDSLQQFRQTLGLLELNDAHPVIMVYLWRLLLEVHNHAGMLLAFHQVLYWFGIALFSCLAAQRLSLRLLLLLVIGLCPPLIILSLHLWKDVGMMSALAIAAALLLGYVRRPHWAWLTAAALALFFAVAVRVNGFIPAMPLLLLLCYFGASRLGRSHWQTAGLTIAGVICLSLVHGAAMGLINTNAKKSYGLGTLVVWDMVSISLAENEDLLPDYVYRSTTEDILPALAAANSTEANYPSYAVVSPYPPERFQKQLIKDWLDLILAHPGAYLSHRGHVLGVLLGVLDREIYYPYHPGIDENEFNIWFTNMDYDELKGYFRLFDKLAASPLYRPWIYGLLAVIVVLIAWIRLLKRRGGDHANILAITVATSGLASAASLLVIATAADYRYITWTILAALLSAVILGADLAATKAARARS